jgi:hypothetical protein
LLSNITQKFSGQKVALHLNRRLWSFTALNSWTGSLSTGFKSWLELYLNRRQPRFTFVLGSSTAVYDLSAGRQLTHGIGTEDAAMRSTAHPGCNGTPPEFRRCPGRLGLFIEFPGLGCL